MFVQYLSDEVCESYGLQHEGELGTALDRVFGTEDKSKQERDAILASDTAKQAEQLATGDSSDQPVEMTAAVMLGGPRTRGDSTGVPRTPGGAGRKK